MLDYKLIGNASPSKYYILLFKDLELSLERYSLSFSFLLGLSCLFNLSGKEKSF